VALARAQRAQTARTLIQSTDLPFGQVAVGAGFRSVRQFNDTVRAVYARTPTELRRRVRSRRPASGAIQLRLPYREPFDGESLIAFLAERAVPGVEELDGSTYRRSLSLEHGAGIVSLTPAARFVRCELRLDDLRDLTAAVARSRRLLDLDADPVSISSQLGQDGPLAPLVRERPGLRVPGCVDGFELAVRAIVGQQVSVPAARTVLGRLAATYGEPLPEPHGELTHRFPSAAALAEADPGALPFPRTRAKALLSLARLCADGELRLDAGSDSAGALAVLGGIRGVGPWTASYVAMRALGDPDVFLPGDVGIRHALARLGGHASDEHWRPWRSYAVMHLWRSLAA
jgi:AraC family transcriptional regulator of adaptative response / DNA-3-methyladenine glycosylase II